MSSHGASTRAQSRVVYAAGLVQGIVLVTFPAASTIFTSAGSYGLSSSQYGAMFLPQAITAVGSSLLQGNLSRRLGGKPVYLAGLCANLAAMILLIASRFAEGSQPVAYPLLALTMFWAMVTAGRLLFAVIQRWFPSRLAYPAQFLPRGRVRAG